MAYMIKRFHPFALALILFIGLATIVLVNLQSLRLTDKVLMLTLLTAFYILTFSFEYYRVKKDEEALGL